jgi:hypothetical protein
VREVRPADPAGRTVRSRSPRRQARPLCGA